MDLMARSAAFFQSIMLPYIWPAFVVMTLETDLIGPILRSGGPRHNICPMRVMTVRAGHPLSSGGGVEL